MRRIRGLWLRFWERMRMVNDEILNAAVGRMRHLGDITKIDGHTAPWVDCIIGGSPCQDLSIAGKRAGLAGARSGLFMEQIRLVKEMGEASGAAYPRYMVWENVPGAFSSNKGQDFAAVIEETIKVIEPEAPDIEVPDKGWPTWGGYRDVDGRWSVAWRVLDAQYWGVPQRRRRIALVADFRGCTAAEILFERKSLFGDFAESGTERERPAGEAENGAAYAVRIRGGCDGGGKGALVQTEKSGTLGTGNDQTVFCLQGNGIDRAETAGCNGKGWREDQSYTLNTVDRPAVVYNEETITSKTNASNPQLGDPCHTSGATGAGRTILVNDTCYDIQHRSEAVRIYDGTAPALTARMGTGGNNVPICIGNGQGDIANHLTPDVCQTLNCMHDPMAIITPTTLDGKEQTSTLCARDYKGVGRCDTFGRVISTPTVRRLTPLECERLQGYPDGWTDIGEWVDTKGKRHKESSDAARYKALGNSIALPPWRFVLYRLCMQLGHVGTMASLFDGIGGFPLIWEQINGKGSCLWASEIEEFPIAVTKRRFGI
nr:MAG TPA: Cytosine specific methyltransferase [Caudoviricetes sp.]